MKAIVPLLLVLIGCCMGCHSMPEPASDIWFNQTQERVSQRNTLLQAITASDRPWLEVKDDAIRLAQHQAEDIERMALHFATEAERCDKMAEDNIKLAVDCEAAMRVSPMPEGSRSFNSIMAETSRQRADTLRKLAKQYLAEAAKSRKAAKDIRTKISDLAQ